MFASNQKAPTDDIRPHNTKSHNTDLNRHLARHKSESPSDSSRNDAGTNETAVETSLQKVDLIETRTRHRYVFNRPRALQYAYRSKVLKTEEESEGNAPFSDKLVHPSIKKHATKGHKHHIHSGVEKQRDHLDIFIDLIWVGIVGNISEVFSSEAFKSEDANPAYAFLLFIVVFLPTWRIWNGIRQFLNNYYMDDILQRLFIFWVLILSVFYGNNLAYLTERTETTKIICIILYLTIRASLTAIEVVYSIYIPWLRRLVFLQALMYVPSIGLWLATLHLKGDKALGTLFPAIIWDYATPMILLSPRVKKLTLGEYSKALDAQHLTTRMASFFVIILGEGVLQMIKDGPLGSGITRTAGIGVWTLAIYFLLTYFYFNRDSSHACVPAVVRMDRRTMLWMSCHITLFSSVLTLTAGMMFLLRDVSQTLDDQSGAVDVPKGELPVYIHRAIWTVAASLATSIFSMTAMALLDRSLDPPGTLRINNRNIRLLGRAVYIVIIVLVPLSNKINPELFLGTCAILLMLLSLWEWTISTERDGAIFEPKGLSVMTRLTRPTKTNSNTTRSEPDSPQVAQC